MNEDVLEEFGWEDLSDDGAGEGADDEDFGDPVGCEVESDLEALALCAQIHGISLDDLVRVVSLRADVSGCIPVSVRRALALLCELFTTFAGKRAAEAPAGYEDWVMWHVTSTQLLEHMRNGLGCGRSRRFALDWDGWYVRGRLVRYYVHIVLITYGILLSDFQGAWLKRSGEQQRRSRKHKLPLRLALRNVCYVNAVLELIGEGDSEDISSEHGSPAVAVYERAKRFALSIGCTDWSKWERTNTGRQVTRRRRDHQNAALRAAGLVGEPVSGYGFYVPKNLPAVDILRRTVHALGWRSLPQGPAHMSAEYLPWRRMWDTVVAPKAREIAAALVSDVGTRESLLRDAIDREHSYAARRTVRDELAHAAPYQGYFVRMARRGELPASRYRAPVVVEE